MFSVMSWEPAMASARAWPVPSSDSAEQPLGPRERRRAMEQLRRWGISMPSPAGKRSTARRTGRGAPLEGPSPKLTVNRREPMAPSRLGNRDGAIVAVPDDWGPGEALAPSGEVRQRVKASSALRVKARRTSVLRDKARGAVDLGAEVRCTPSLGDRGSWG